jgi:hypothetical protein
MSRGMTEHETCVHVDVGTEHEHTKKVRNT